MNYLITTRRAVATLEEAHEWIQEEYAWTDFCVLDGDLPVRITSLHDGTVIEIDKPEPDRENER